MKKVLLTLILLITFLLGQDYIVTKDGKELPGKYIKHDANNIFFIYKDKSLTTKIPIFNIKGLRLSNGNLLDKNGLATLGTRPTIKSTIFLKTGHQFEGILDKKSLELTGGDNKGNIKFKRKFSSKYKLYNLQSINFIKSWNGSLIYPNGVAANNKTKLYHLSNVRHLPKPENKRIFKTEKEAKKELYKPCSACFNTNPLIPDYNLESSLVRSAIISFQNNREILYEHPMLKDLNKTIDSILSNWPETLKGYDYRLQVYKDKSPNALAIGGGNLYVSTGLLDMIEDPLELESVLAHEVAHVERRHALRQFYEHQQKQTGVLLATLLVGITVAASGGDSQDVVAASTITEAIAGFGALLALQGYSRELEQESDVLAQVYLNNLEKDKDHMVNLFDKFATYQISREGYLDEGIMAFSSHPSLLARMNQIEKSVMHRYDNPLVFTATPNNRSDISSGFFEMEINYIFVSPSSVSNKENLFFVLGEMKNNHQELSFKIDKMSLVIDNVQGQLLEEKSGKTNSDESNVDYVLTNNGKELPGKYVGYENGMVKFIYEGEENNSSLPIKNISGIRLADGSILNENNIIANVPIDKFAQDIKSLRLEGLDNQISIFDSNSEFMAVIRSPLESSGLLFNALKSKNVLINTIDLSAVVVEAGQDEKAVKGFNKINCSMAVR